MSDRDLPLRDELDADGALEGADLLAAVEKLADRLATFVAVVLGQSVHVHPDETVGQARVEASPVLKRIGECLLTRLEPESRLVVLGVTEASFSAPPLSCKHLREFGKH